MIMKKGFLHPFLPAIVLLILAAFSISIKNPADKPAEGNQTENSIFRDKSAGSKRPNILFCIADDATFRHMSAYGCKWIETPAFDRIAREGLLFSNESILPFF